MLRVEIKFEPHGDMRRSQKIGELLIGNTGGHPDRPLRGNYEVLLSNPREGTPPRQWTETCQVEGFPRQERDAFDLVLWALLKLLGDRNEGAVAAAFKRIAERTPGFMQKLAFGAAGIERSRQQTYAARDQALAAMRRYRKQIKAIADAGPDPSAGERGLVVAMLAAYAEAELCRSEADAMLAEGDDLEVWP